jgi:hypothetical protein
VISFEVIKQQTDAHRAELYREAAVERLVAQASAGRRGARHTLALALRTLAERLDRASCLPSESCAASSARV